MRVARVGFGVVIAMALGCATTADSPPATPEPAIQDVSHWRLQAPAVTQVELRPYTAQNPWEQELARVAAASGGRVLASKGMQCTARETARFFLTYQALPSPTLRRFIATRCGAIAINPGVQFVHATVPDELTDEQLRGQWIPSVADLAHKAATGAQRRSAGLYYGRENGTAVVMATWGERKVRIEPASVTPRNGRVVLRGRMLVPSTRVMGTVNEGRYGFALCESRDVLLPDFAIDCPIAPGDTSAQIQLTALPPGRVMSQGVLSFEARREGANEFRPYPYASDVPVGEPAQIPQQLLAAVNNVRREAGLQPAVLDGNQTAVAAKRTPEFFAAIARRDGARIDRIALQLVAGRSVSGMVRHGDFVAAAVSPELDVGQWLTSVLQDPSGRRVLLDPDATTLAFAAEIKANPPRMDVLALGYSLFDVNTAEADARRVVERLTAARAERDRKPPELLPQLESKARATANRMRANEKPERAMKELLEESALLLNRPVGSSWFQVSDLDAIQFPDEFVDSEDLELAIGVSHRRAVGSDYPWAHYLVFMVVADPPVSAGRRR